MTDFQLISLINYDQELAKDPNATILDIREQGLVYANQATELIKTLFGGVRNKVSAVASCVCGKRNTNAYIGQICPECKTEVKLDRGDDMRFRCWITIPEELPPLMHPDVYLVLAKWLGSGNLLKVLLDPSKDLPKEFHKYKDLPRGLGEISNNMDYLMDCLEDYFIQKKSVSKQRTTPLIREFIDRNSDRLFTRSIPILNSSLHTITQEGAHKYTDVCSEHILTLYVDLNNIFFNLVAAMGSVKRTIISMAKVQESFNNYTMSRNGSILTHKIAKKKGLIRNHVGGTRAFFTFRSVIIPNTVPHAYDEVWVPRQILFAAIKPMILNILIYRFGYTLTKADEEHTKSLLAPNPKVEEAVAILFSECPFKGFPILLNRNPTLAIGSIQTVFITKYHENHTDQTIKVSPRIRERFNFDFDKSHCRS
jgi:hypothetical protein